ncbi:VOC family protein [Roseomonas gilardii]|uniref:VOC family protein n=1 Tax=Roseomonas gilardii TaxID=257708 RepID=A0ABU3MIQ5_9PROT|nr:VOC family protein [Roseomonas gilardii]MDT8332886.1 VOC family protein [Roseomonas gilardii]
MSTRFHHINFASKQLPEIENFYKEVLQLDESHAYASNSANAQVTDKGYGGRVAFLTDGAVEMHLSTKDLGVAFRTKQAINPLANTHIAFRTDDIEGIKRRLTERGVPYADYGAWAIKGWTQIFFYDPEGNIVEVHQVGEPSAQPGA